MRAIPILVIAYCRPIEFERLLSEIENLSERRVTISLDGPTSGLELMTDEVHRLAEKWQISSKHEISIMRSSVNLGLFAHFRKALEVFFNNNPHGLVLEDDMEIRKELVKFLDSRSGQLALDRYWSICGHYPMSKNHGSGDLQKNDLRFFESEVHTIWGWASSSQSVKFFLDFSHKHRNDPDHLKRIASGFAHRSSKDPIFRWALSKNWHGKIVRATSVERPNWDNFWVIAGWASGKKSLLPTISLSRENPLVYGLQTHKRATFGVPWSFSVFSENIKFKFPVKISKREHIRILSVWGSSRLGAYKQALVFVLNKCR
jgi:hypothetical protein